MPSVINDDMLVRGLLQATSMVVPANSVQDSAVGPNPLSADKLQHNHRAVYKHVGTAASETCPLHVVVGASGTIQSFSAGSVAVAVGAATVTVDLKKNGVTVLSAVITLNSGSVAYTSYAGTISGANVVAGDVLTVETVATAGGGTLPTGVFATLDILEDAA